MSATPKAIIDNGSLELIHANSKRGLIGKMVMTFFFGKNYAVPIIQTMIQVDSACPAQIDGEPFMQELLYNVNTHSKILRVIA